MKPRLDALEGLRTEAAGYRRKTLYLVGPPALVALVVPVAGLPLMVLALGWWAGST